MTVATEEAYAERQYTGAETSFTAGFSALATTDISAGYFNAAGQPVALIQGVHFSVALDAQGAATLTRIAFPSATAAAPLTIFIRRTTSALQIVNFQNGALFDPAVHQRIADGGAMREAELRGQLSRDIAPFAGSSVAADARPRTLKGASPLAAEDAATRAYVDLVSGTTAALQAVTSAVAAASSATAASVSTLAAAASAVTAAANAIILANPDFGSVTSAPTIFADYGNVPTPPPASNIMTVNYLVSDGEGISGHGWELRARTLTALAFPVPTFQPTTPGVTMAVDLQPLGASPIENASNGWTWLDCCNADIMNDNLTPVTCGRVGVRTINGAAAGYVGTIPFNGAPAGNFWIVTGLDAHPRWGVAYNGNFLPYEDNTYSLGLLANRATAVYAVNGTIQTSDEREKTDIAPTRLGLDFIKALRPVSYRWREGDDASVHQGVIAQNVLAAAAGQPCGVIAADKLALNYAELIGPLIRAVQELAAAVEGLRR